MTDLEEQTFCIYCQKEFQRPDTLRKHVFENHQDTHIHAAFIRRGYPRLNWRRKEEE